MAATAFRIEETDFALRLEYPVFILNIVDWLTGEDADLIDGYTTGKAWRIYTGQSDVRTGWLVSPNGDGSSVDVADGYLTFYPEEPGFYDLYWGDSPSQTQSPDRVLAANLSDLDESSVRPRAEPVFEPTSDVSAERAAGLPLDRDPWFYLILAAALLLVFEWVTFNRRVTV